MVDLKRYIRNIPDFPSPGILFRDISPLLREHLAETIVQIESLLEEEQWRRIDAIAGIESRGFILGSALALKRGKGFVLIRKQGKLPPPVVSAPYRLEYGTGVLEMQPGSGRLLLIDDVLATGGTLHAGATLAMTAGYEVAALAVLIDLKLAPDFRWEQLVPLSVIQYDSAEAT
ncbi:MAG TPA: adenine phosphoribosyltransferase [Steroidobacter sp.]